MQRQPVRHLKPTIKSITSGIVLVSVHSIRDSVFRSFVKPYGKRGVGSLHLKEIDFTTYADLTGLLRWSKRLLVSRTSKSRSIHFHRSKLISIGVYKTSHNIVSP